MSVRNKNRLRAISLLMLIVSFIPLRGVAFAAAALPPADLFQLPWELGTAWMAVDGLDDGTKRPTTSSHYYLNGGAIDFAPRSNMVTGEDTSNFWVTAAAGGTVKEASTCHVKITHDGGWTTEYQFLGKVQVKVGDVVARNQRLGIIADGIRYKYCVGYEEPNTPHLHFMLRPALSGATFAGWQVKYSSFWNSTTFTKDGKTVGLFKPLLNDFSTPTPTPTATLISTATPNALATATAIAQTATAGAPATATAIAQTAVAQTSTAIAQGTPTPGGQVTATPDVSATLTAGAQATSTPDVQATLTAGAGQTVTPDVQATLTAGAGQTATPNAPATLTAMASTPTPSFSTPTPDFNATQTAIAGGTATPDVFATQTALAQQTATAVGQATFTPTAFSGPHVTTTLGATNLSIGASTLVTVTMHNTPLDGYTSAEFTCTYNPTLVEASNLTLTSLFGADPAVITYAPQAGTFILGIAGTQGNKATASGVAFTFDIKALQTGQTSINCTARISKGDNILTPLPSSGSDLVILGTVPTPTPATPVIDTPVPTATLNSGVPSPTPTATSEPPGTLTGQVIAYKPVTINIYDGNNTLVASVPANPDGTFAITLPGGVYTVTASASGYLPAQGTFIVSGNSVTTLPAITLPAGDIDGNLLIDQFDALTIGMSYNTASPAEADLNNDGVVNVLDLELLAQNYRKTGPVIWQ